MLTWVVNQRYIENKYIIMSLIWIYFWLYDKGNDFDFSIVDIPCTSSVFQN